MLIDNRKTAKIGDTLKASLNGGSMLSNFCGLFSIYAFDKSSLFNDALRPKDQARIDCGTAHFEALGQEAKFIKANDYDSFTAQY